MAYIAQADYYAGVFLATILKSTKAVPMICDATNEAKRIEFETDIGNFNVYVKHSCQLRHGWDYHEKPKKERIYWQIPFSANEVNYLKNIFAEKNKQNLIAIVCTDKNLSETKIAVLMLNEAMSCLSTTYDKNGQGKITVSRTGGNFTFDCFGVGHKQQDSDIHPYINHLRFFDDAK